MSAIVRVASEGCAVLRQRLSESVSVQCGETTGLCAVG